jgi:hypothetical protein
MSLNKSSNINSKSDIMASWQSRSRIGRSWIAVHDRLRSKFIYKTEQVGSSSSTVHCCAQ